MDVTYQQWMKTEDRHALVLIKSMRNIEGYEDLIQLAAAIEI